MALDAVGVLGRPVVLDHVVALRRPPGGGGKGGAERGRADLGRRGLPDTEAPAGRRARVRVGRTAGRQRGRRTVVGGRAQGPQRRGRWRLRLLRARRVELDEGDGGGRLRTVAGIRSETTDAAIEPPPPAERGPGVKAHPAAAVVGQDPTRRRGRGRHGLVGK